MKPLVVANWKMNPTTLREAKKLFDLVTKGIKNVKNVEVVICPPFPYLSRLQVTGYRLQLGAQDCFWAKKGAFTGEVSPRILKDLGVKYVIIGHSERRKYLNETDRMVNKKLKAVLKENLKPILCISRTSQIKKRLKGFSEKKLKNIVFVYEPVWAISTTKGGSAASWKKAKRGADLIRKALTKLFNKSFAQKVRVIYGGSINSKNIQDFVNKAKVDGGLVGAASLDAQGFIKTIKNASRP